MYFIVAGEVAVERPDAKPVTLRTGQFFGEIALIDDRPWSDPLKVVQIC